ncbi:MAG: hypothetical protein V3S71_06485 [Acidobacteriota bacterium]
MPPKQPKTENEVRLAERLLRVIQQRNAAVEALERWLNAHEATEVARRNAKRVLAQVKGDNGE